VNRDSSPVVRSVRAGGWVNIRLPGHGCLPADAADAPVPRDGTVAEAPVVATAHIAVDAVDYFQLPRHHTVLLGSAIEI
jgi:hypothetical protein